MLAKVIATKQRDWDLHVPAVLAAYRASQHESTGFTPNFLVFGHENRAPLDLLLPSPPGATDEPLSDYVAELRVRIRDAHQLARETLGHAAETRKRYYDTQVKSAAFKPGDWVWKYYPRRFKGRSPKWTSWYVGPYLVVRDVPPCNVSVQRSPRSPMEIVHVDKLKMCFGPTPKSWLRPDLGPDLAECAEEPLRAASHEVPSDTPPISNSTPVEPNPKQQPVAPLSLDVASDHDLPSNTGDSHDTVPAADTSTIDQLGDMTPPRRNPHRVRRPPRRYRQ
jgi:hypothetical protein